jgi:hypothetical protein
VEAIMVISDITVSIFASLTAWATASKALRIGDDFPGVAFVVEVFAAGFEDDVHQLLFVGCSFGNGDDALLRKHEADGVGLAEVAAALREGVANFADRAIAVVGGAVNDDGDAAGTVALEGNFFVGGAGELTGAALDGALDVVVGHVLSLGGGDGAAQARVAVGSPPDLAAMLISLISCVKILPRFASSAPFLCLIVAHFEWPDMGTSESILYWNFGAKGRK